MIKSINYQANQIASIEISDASDVQSLGDSYGYGSTARVTGQIGDEYIYTPQGWIKISSGGGGGSGGVFVVTMTFHADEGDTETSGESYWTADKTCLEIVEALEQGKNVYAVVGDGDYKDYFFLSNAYHVYLESGVGIDILFSTTEFGYDDDVGEYKLTMKGFEMRWLPGGTDSVEYQECYITQE